MPQGVSDVQSIRATQTADPRAKQTHPSRPARGSARVNTRSGGGDSPGSMPVGRFRWGEVVESFLGQPPLAGLPAVADRSGPQRGGAGNLRCSPGAENAIAAVFAGAGWQCCRTHFMANLLTRVPNLAWPPRTFSHGPHHLPATVSCRGPRPIGPSGGTTPGALCPGGRTAGGCRAGPPGLHGLPGVPLAEAVVQQTRRNG